MSVVVAAGKALGFLFVVCVVLGWAITLFALCGVAEDVDNGLAEPGRLRWRQWAFAAWMFASAFLVLTVVFLVTEGGAA